MRNNYCEDVARYKYCLFLADHLNSPSIL